MGSLLGFVVPLEKFELEVLMGSLLFLSRLLDGGINTLFLPSLDCGINVVSFLLSLDSGTIILSSHDCCRLAGKRAGECRQATSGGRRTRDERRGMADAVLAGDVLADDERW